MSPNKPLLILTLTGITSPLSADEKSLHSSLAITQKRQGKTVELRFLPKANSGYLLNLDAPWQLEMPACDGFLSHKKTLGKSSFAPQTGEVVVVASSNGTVKTPCAYTLRAFMCTNDKKQCFRDEHKGTIIVQ